MHNQSLTVRELKCFKNGWCNFVVCFLVLYQFLFVHYDASVLVVSLGLQAREGEKAPLSLNSRLGVDFSHKLVWIGGDGLQSTVKRHDRLCERPRFVFPETGWSTKGGSSLALSDAA